MFIFKLPGSVLLRLHGRGQRRNPGETRVFDCNKRGPCGDTALMLACRAGLLVLATMLKDAGANVSVANDQGDTPLLDSEFWPGLSLSLCRERERERARARLRSRYPGCSLSSKGLSAAPVQLGPQM